MEQNYLDSVKKQFEYYKMIAEQSIEQVPEAALFWQYNEESNSIAIIIKHLWGNMMSRWTDFLTTDGEKEGRMRDAEFENEICSKEDLLALWKEGWDCLFAALNALSDADLQKTIYIRNLGHTATEAINRQLAHYPYHIGQIVYIAKMTSNNQWKNLSIPKGNSAAYNAEKFAAPRTMQHFTEEYLKK